MTYADVFARIEDHLEKLHEAGEIVVNDGDCDLVALHIAGDVRDVTNPARVRKIVERVCFEPAKAGMLGHPEIHPDLAELVLNP